MKKIQMNALTISIYAVGLALSVALFISSILASCVASVKRSATIFAIVIAVLLAVYVVIVALVIKKQSVQKIKAQEAVIESISQEDYLNIDDK